MGHIMGSMANANIDPVTACVRVTTQTNQPDNFDLTTLNTINCAKFAATQHLLFRSELAAMVRPS